MINFFRKTRKKLINDNKPLKYARYAIGEIVLVVIGILIALQINNWNEIAKDRKEELLALSTASGSICFYSCCCPNINFGRSVYRKI